MQETNAIKNNFIWQDSYFSGETNSFLRIFVTIFDLIVSVLGLFFCFALINAFNTIGFSIQLFIISIIILSLSGFLLISSLRSVTYTLLSKKMVIFEKGVFFGKERGLFGRKMNWVFYNITNTENVFIPWNNISKIVVNKEKTPWFPFHLYAFIRFGTDYHFSVFTKDNNKYEKIIYDFNSFLAKNCDKFVLNKEVFK